MTELELRELLQTPPQAHDQAAEDRAWEVVRRAYGPATATQARRRWRWRVATPAVACLIAVVAIGLMAASAPRDALARWLRNAIGLSARPASRPLLAGLPGGGEMLINSPIGPWIVHRDGRRRYLGRYVAAAWSPHSLFVIAWRGSMLTALDLNGRRQWALTAMQPVTTARWSLDGYRIAYLAGRSLWIVAGDGSGNHRLPVVAGAVAPAWQPGAELVQRIAFVNERGEVELRDADTGALVWRVRPPASARQLLWSSDGTRLLVVAADRLSLYDAGGSLLASRALTRGQTAGAAAFAPGDDRVALVLRRVPPATNSVDLLDATPDGLDRVARVLFSAPERIAGLGWSPDGQWVLASAPAADQWIFIRTQPPTRLAAVSQITGKFDPGARPSLAFPALGGWQR